MFFKIALRNVRRQIGGYMVYFITVALTVSLLFSLNSIIFSDFVLRLSSVFRDEVTQTSVFLSVFLSLISSAVLGYGNAFLLRRRKKEFGLYLTLGMTRTNILGIFMAELLLTFLFSLVAGIGLGILVYQVILSIISQYLGLDFVWGSYSVQGMALTAAMVGIMFVFCALVSAIYLRLASVSKLLKGEEAPAKITEHPVIWFNVMLVFAVVLALSLAAVVSAVAFPGMPNYVTILIGGAALSFISVVMVYVGAMKSGIFCLLKNRKFSSKGTRTFTLRQLSGRLNADSALFGVIAVLLSIAITGGNIFLTSVGGQVAQSDVNNPYTANLTVPYNASEELTEDVPEWLEEFGEVGQIYKFDAFVLDSHALTQYITVKFVNNDVVMRRSDYVALMKLLGREEQPPEKGVGVLCNGCNIAERKYAQGFDFGGFEMDIGGHSLPITYVAPINNALVVDEPNRYVVIAPDEAVDDLAESGGYGYALTSYAITYRGDTFDGDAFRQFFLEKNELPQYSAVVAGSYGIGFFSPDVSGDFEDYLMQMAAPWLMIVMFITISFALLSMAVLGLKSLASVAEDRRRYRLLYFAGATRGEVLRSLIVQLVLYFFLPFAVPVVLNVPVCAICMAVNGMLGGYMPNIQVVGYAAAFSAVLLLVYGLYCAATCLICGREVARSLYVSG